MHGWTSTTRGAWRMFAVLLLAFFSLLSTLPDIALSWHPFSDFGLQFDVTGKIVGVDRGSSADKAGVRTGERVDLAATPLTSRQYMVTGYAAAPRGLHADFAISDGTKSRLVRLVSMPHPRSLADNLTNDVLMIASAGLVAISAVLVLLRPSKMTWAFFLYGATALVGSVLLAAALPLWAFVVQALTFSTALTLSWIPFAIFALRFPNDAATGWRRVAQNAVLASLVVFVPLAMWQNVGVLAARPAPDAISLLLGFLQLGGLLFVAAIFALTYAHAASPDRARLRWVMVGMLVGYSGVLAFQLSSYIPGFAFAAIWPIAVVNLLQALQIAVPITVAYAIVRHRVFDVRFVLGRAVVYGLLTTLVVALVAAIDFVAGKVLASTRLAAIGEAGAAIVIGLSLNPLHKRLERFIDTVLFRSRRRAEQRLRRVAAGLPHARSADAITHAIVSEPVEAFALTSAAVFRRDPSGRFVRGEAVGWETDHLRSIDADASVTLQLRAGPRSIAVDDASWPNGALPEGTYRPAVALPVEIRSVFEAIVLYGPHASGEDLDPEEIAILEALLAAAATAYDHVAAETAMQHLARLEAELRVLRTQS